MYVKFPSYHSGQSYIVCLWLSASALVWSGNKAILPSLKRFAVKYLCYCGSVDIAVVLPQGSKLINKFYRSTVHHNPNMFMSWTSPYCITTVICKSCPRIAKFRCSIAEKVMGLSFRNAGETVYCCNGSLVSYWCNIVLIHKPHGEICCTCKIMTFICGFNIL